MLDTINQYIGEEEINALLAISLDDYHLDAVQRLGIFEQFNENLHRYAKLHYNIEKSSGNEMQLKDIFKDNYNYKDIINKEISRQISKDPDRYFTGKDGFNGIGDNQNFYIKNNKVVIYFGLYEIETYAAGISEFIISNNLFEGNLKYGKI